MLQSNWWDYIDFTYDADGNRVKKVYDAGYWCECGDPELMMSGGGGDTLALESSISSPLPWDSAIASSTAEWMDPEGEGGAEAQAAAPGGLCVCRSKTTMLYVHTYDGRVVREYSDNQGTVARDYMWAGDKRVGVFEYGPFAQHFFITDHLGSTRQVLDATGQVKSKYDYFAYGGTRRAISSLNTKVRYTGKYLDDEAGLNQTYYGARYLDNGLLRFTSVDPLQAKYPGWSPYVYSACNPIRLKDPDGAGVAGYLIGLAAAVVSDLTLSVGTVNVSGELTSFGAVVVLGWSVDRSCRDVSHRLRDCTVGRSDLTPSTVPVSTEWF